MEIKLANICKAFDGRIVLHNVNLTLAPGEITCLMGPSGIGKTTLVNILAGLLKADGGEISGLNGLRVSAVFQEDRLLEWETALRNVEFVTRKRGTGDGSAVLRCAQDTEPSPCPTQLLTQAGLGSHLHKKAAELSGGMKRRVCICRALAAEYDILLLDEPFKGLDDGTKTMIMNMVKKHIRPGAYVLCVTHDVSEVEILGGRLISLNRKIRSSEIQNENSPL